MFRLNSQGQVENVQLTQQEVVEVIASREVIVEALNKAQAQVDEIQKELAEYDALVASQPASAPADDAINGAADATAGGAQ